MRILTGIAVALTLAGGASQSLADDNGVAGIHGWRKVGDKTCFIDHSHEGSGHGRTQQAALADAIRSWTDFTDLEYGSDWAVYGRSIAKSVSCIKDSDGFKCDISSIPCRGGSVGTSPARSAKRMHKPL